MRNRVTPSFCCSHCGNNSQQGKEEVWQLQEDPGAHGGNLKTATISSRFWAQKLGNVPFSIKENHRSCPQAAPALRREERNCFPLLHLS